MQSIEVEIQSFKNEITLLKKEMIEIKKENQELKKSNDLFTKSQSDKFQEFEDSNLSDFLTFYIINTLISTNNLSAQELIGLINFLIIQNIHSPSPIKIFDGICIPNETENVRETVLFYLSLKNQNSKTVEKKIEIKNDIVEMLFLTNGLKSENFKNCITKFSEFSFSILASSKYFESMIEKINFIKTNIESKIFVNIILDEEDPANFKKACIDRIDINDSISRIKKNLFANCISLTNITIPPSVSSIGERCFENCINLKKISILSPITTIPDYCFSKCKSLKSVVIPLNATSIGNGAFENCSSLTEIKIPESVINIGDHCFSSCSLLETITISCPLQRIGDHCFHKCKSLKTITIPASTTYIGAHCFGSCSQLSMIKILSPIQKIENYCFNKCKSLTTFSIPSTVTELCHHCFNKCGALKFIIIPKSVTKIGNLCFNLCINLIQALVPRSVTSIEADIFNGCSSLRTIIAPEASIDTFTGIKEPEQIANKVDFQAEALFLKMIYKNQIDTNLRHLVDSIKEKINEGNHFIISFYLDLVDANDGINVDQEEYDKIAEFVIKGDKEYHSKYAAFLKSDKGKYQNKKQASQFLEEASKAGNIDAMYLYNIMLRYNESVPNEKLADEYLKKAADAGHLDAICDLAESLIANNDKDEAVNLLKIAADKGRQEAIFQYAMILLEIQEKKEAAKYFKKSADSSCNAESMYYYAAIIKELNEAQREQDKSANLNYNSEVVKYLKKAAERRHLKSIVLLADMLYEGDGVAVNLRDAKNYYLMAARMDDAGSLYRYGLILLNDGYRANQAKGLKCIKKAADNGCIKAMHEYANSTTDSNEKDLYFKMACDNGYVPSMINYANKLFVGLDGIQQDKEKAAFYYRKAADDPENGDSESMLKLAKMSNIGDGIPINKKEAAKYYKMAADRGIPEAMETYGWMLDNSDGIAGDKREAAKYYKMAADNGSVEAMFNYGWMLQIGDGIPDDKKEAARYYKVAADNGNIEAMENYAYMLKSGDGIPKDEEEAEKYFEMAKKV